MAIGKSVTGHCLHDDECICCTATCAVVLSHPHACCCDAALRYGLSTIHAARGYAGQAKVERQQFERWCREPINLNRPKHLRMLRSTTCASMLEEINRFQGWCFLYQEVLQPRLAHLLNAHLVVGFLSFLRARDVIREKLRAFVNTTQRVVTWLQVTGQLSGSDTTRLPRYVDWMDNLAHQLGTNLVPKPKASLAQLIAEGKWMKPEELMHYMALTCGKALQAAQQGISVRPQAVMPVLWLHPPPQAQCGH